MSKSTGETVYNERLLDLTRVRVHMIRAIAEETNTPLKVVAQAMLASEIYEFGNVVYKKGM
jgi:hypothetical protein